MKRNLLLLFLIPLLVSCAEEKISSITMRESTLELESGKTHTLTYSYQPANLDRPIVQWTSSNSNVVEIQTSNNHNCQIVAKEVGSATITCTELSSGNKLSTTCKVNVFSNAQFSTQLISLEKGQSVDLYSYISGVEEDVYWQSTDENICYIEYGTLYAKEVGECMVKCHLITSNVELTCKVQVTNIKPSDLECESNLKLFFDIENDNNNIYSVSYNLLPQDAAAEVSLTSSNSGIIEVLNGTSFVVKQAGTAVLTLTTDNGITKNIQVFVSDDITDFVSGFATIIGGVRINGVLVSGYLVPVLQNHSKARVYAVEYTLYIGSTICAHQYFDAGNRPIVGIGQPNGESYYLTEVSCSYIDESSCWCSITYEYNGQQYTISKY